VSEVHADVEQAVPATATDGVRSIDAKLMPVRDNVPAPVFGPFFGVRAESTGESNLSINGCELAIPATLMRKD
jgi:hypothetical protein